MHTTALVLFSGGQDSATCLAHALSRYARVETLGFDYGQRHRVELQARLSVLAQLRAGFPEWAPRLGEDHVLDLGVLSQIGGSSLTEDMAFQMQADGLPNTFVPGRNLLFLTLAGALAYRRGLQVLVTGVCETDYSGYPDCRDDTMKAMQIALSLGLERRLRIETSADVDRQGRHLAPGAATGRAGAGRSDRRAHAHLLPGRALAAACLGLRLRHLPGL